MGSCLSIESRSPLPSSPKSPLGIRKRKNSKKRPPGSRSSSFDYRKAEQLHRIPGRLFLNGCSEVASLFTQQGKKGTNQDAMVVWENFASRTDTIFCGVFDGHGPFGHMVAKRVRDSLPLKLSSYCEGNVKSSDVFKETSASAKGSMYSEDASLVFADEDSRAYIDADETEKYTESLQVLKESFLKAYKLMDRELRMHRNIDCYCSGTTAVTLIKQGQDLVIGNVGDSRAVLCTRDEDGSLVAVQLTVDLKPNLPGEEERIRKCKGRVFALQEEPEVARVWLPNHDSPGLAMARAFGDFCLKDFGLISIPEITCRRLTERDKFVVLATDGIWDVLSNEEMVEIVALAQPHSSAARALVESAVRAWRYKYPTSKVDDCAVICLFFDSNSDKIAASSTATCKERTNTADRAAVGCSSEKEGYSGEGSNDDDDDVEESAMKKEDSNLEVGEDWSALEGVSRVNTLLTLPRFVLEKDEKHGPGDRRTRK